MNDDLNELIKAVNARHIGVAADVIQKVESLLNTSFKENELKDSALQLISDQLLESQLNSPKSEN